MSRLHAFIEAAKSEKAGLDQAMFEVYRDLTADMTGFTMIDGGAHKGWHTLRMLQLSGCETVWSIEADPTIGAVLTDNLEKWRGKPVPALRRIARVISGETPPDLQLIKAALQDDPATTEIPWMSSHSHVGRSSIRSKTEEGAVSIWTEHKDVEYRDEVSVPATTLDLIVGDDPRALPFIKLDLEGADILALRGAAGLLRGKRPVVAFENSEKAPGVHGYTLDDVAAFFAGLDYVPLNYVGEEMQRATWFDFYEAWAVPREQLTLVQGLINRAIDARLTS